MSKIEWTDETWNPIVGCSKISEGCQNCYAERMAYRLSGMGVPFYDMVVHGSGGWNGNTELVESALEKPLHWRKPRKIFICSMGDLFHESVDWAWIDTVMQVIAKCPQHTFQVLTKRPDAMQSYFTQPDLWTYHIPGVMSLPNLHLGVTCENQKRQDRLDTLRDIPAAVRYVSFEPLLEALPDLDLTGISWCIVGPETGPKARPCQNDWIKDIVDQCRSANVPVFVKKIVDNAGKPIEPPAKFWPREMPK